MKTLQIDSIAQLLKLIEDEAKKKIKSTEVGSSRGMISGAKYDKGKLL